MFGSQWFAAPVSAVSVSSSAGEWEGGTGAFTFSGDDVARSSTNSAIRTVTALTGDFTFTMTYTDGDGATRFGVYDATEDSTFAGTGSDNGGMDSMTNSWVFDSGNEQYRYGGVNQAAENIAEGSVIKVTRTGSTIKFVDDGSDAYTFSQTFSGAVRVVFGGGGIALDFDDVTWIYNE